MLRTIQLEGNLGDTSTETTPILAEISTTDEGVENSNLSKLVYLNDSFDLDTIRLDVDTIIDINDNVNSS